LAPETTLLLGHSQVGKSVVFSHLTCSSPAAPTVVHRGVSFEEAALSPGGKRKLRDLVWGVVREARRARKDNRGPGEDATVDRLLAAPGVTNLFAENDRARAVRDLLLSRKIDRVLIVADAKNLRRSLALFLEVAELDLPVAIDLNMVDEARDIGLSIDSRRLSHLLGTEAVPTVAIMGEGLERLPAAIRRASTPSVRASFPRALTGAVEKISAELSGLDLPVRAVALCLLLDDPSAGEILEAQLDAETRKRAEEAAEEARRALFAPVEQMVAEGAYGQAKRLADMVTEKAEPQPAFLSRLGRWAADPLYGTPIALAVLLLAYGWVGYLGAGIMVDLIDQRLFRETLMPLAEDALQVVPWALVRQAVIDPAFGLLPTGLFLALGLLFPVLLFFNVFFAVLEDSGYLPRLSVLLDRGLRRVGLNGRGVLPLVLGFSCVTMALLTTRTLRTKKERLIASLLLVGLPCAPLLAVTLVVLQPLDWTALVTFFALILARVLLLGTMGNRVFPGRAQEFIMEIPPMRIPSFRRIVPASVNRTVRFLAEALPVFLLASLVLFTLDRLGGLDALERAADPVVHSMLGLPDQAVQVFLKTIIRRENGAAELSLVRDHFDGVQTLVTLVIMTFIFPCINAGIVLIKERGVKVGLALIFSQVFIALGTGALLMRACRWLGVTFA
jgi:ferrous iron transport protein B